MNQYLNCVIFICLIQLNLIGQNDSGRIEGKYHHTTEGCAMHYNFKSVLKLELSVDSTFVSKSP